MSPRKGAHDPTDGATSTRRDILWVWMAAATLLWALVLTVPRSDDPTAAETLILIGAIIATFAALLVYSRRNVTDVAEAAAAAAIAAINLHQQQLEATAAAAGTATPPAPTPPPAPVDAATAAGRDVPPVPTPRPAVTTPLPVPTPVPEPPAVEPAAASDSRKGELLRPCPCGFCETMVEDANGYLTSVTAWVIAVERLCKQASEAMVKGGWVHLPVYEFANDTEALKELLVQTCHEGGGTRAIWTIQGLVTVWEQTLFRVEQEIAATVEPGRYLAWHTATADIRANRHGD